VTSRAYTGLVAVWVAAAALAVAWSLSRQEVADEGAAEALPADLPGVRVSFETDDTLPSALAGVVTEPVQGGWTGPGGRPFHVVVRSARAAEYRYRLIGRETFDLVLRGGDPGPAYDACSSCHRGQAVVVGTREDPQGVHQDIRPVHPAETGAACSTCHADVDVGRLRLENGETAPRDHAYRLCAQCHFEQVESWAYGAHGKRLVGWRGRRVVMGCADCHDPHRPATEPRRPMTAVRLPGPLRGATGEGVTSGERGGEGARHE